MVARHRGTTSRHLQLTSFSRGIEESFKKACGHIGGIERFTVVRPDKDVMDDDYEYDWDNDNLRRSEDLADVWSEVSLEIKDFFKETFSENQK